MHETSRTSTLFNGIKANLHRHSHAALLRIIAHYKIRQARESLLAYHLSRFFLVAGNRGLIGALPQLIVCRFDSLSNSEACPMHTKNKDYIKVVIFI